MTSFTEFTQSGLPILESVNKLALSKPKYTSGVVSQSWSNLTSIMQAVEVSLVSPVNLQLKSLNNQINQTVKQNVNTQIQSLQTQSQNTINGLLDPITELINRLIEGIQGIFDKIKDWFEGVIGTISDVINNVSDWITQAIDNVSVWIVSAVDTLTNKVVTTVNNVIDAVKTWFETVYNNVRDYLSNLIGNVGDWINGVYLTIKDFIDRTGRVISATYEGLKKSIEDKIQDIINWIEGAKKAIVAWWHGVLSSVANFIDTKLIPFIETATVDAKKVMEMFGNIWGAISSGDYQGAFDIIDNLFKSSGLPAPIAAIRSMVSVLAYFWESVHLQFVGLEYNAQVQARASLQLEALDMGSATQAFYKGVMSSEDYIDNANLAGINKQRALTSIEANRPLPSAGQIQDSFLRGEINLEQHDKLLTQYGLSPSNIELIKELYLIIPGVSDLIRMAVREAFTPEIAQKFGQYEDLPVEFVNWGLKQGLSKDWCSRYWAAHWDLPSASMGFEMLHRGVVTGDELKLLLRALDVMPFWREKLIQISYNPLTRVDVRRMYKAGVITEEQVKRSYLDLGYNDEKAGWLTDFTKRYYTPEDTSQQDEFKNLARGVYSTAFKKHIISEDEYREMLKTMNYYTDDIDLLVQIDSFAMLQEDKLFTLKAYRTDWKNLILSAYDRGLLHENEVTPMLIELGYDDNEASLEIGLSDYNRQLKIRNLVANQVHDQYVNFIIDNVGMHSLLDQFNFTSEEINKLQEEWDIERALRAKRPSLTDLRRFLTQKIISVDQFLDELRGEGYNEKYIDYYSQSLAMQKA